MDSLEYIEMSACEQMLNRVNAGSEQRTPWNEGTDEKMAIVKEYLAYRYNELKEKV